MSHDPVLSHPEVLAMGWLPAGLLRVAPDGSTVRTDGGDAYTERVEVLARKGYSLDRADKVTAAWCGGYCLRTDAPYPRVAAMGHGIGRGKAPEGVACYRLLDPDDGSALLEALDAAGEVIATWRVDSLTKPDRVSRR